MKIHFQFFNICTILVLLSPILSAQCPAALPGHHRVEKGETLYKISKRYNVSIDQICEWSNIDKDAPLSICQELAVKPPINFDPEIKTDFKAASLMETQTGGQHVIQEGETIAGIAEIYGFTEKRFRAFNGLKPDEPAWPGLVLRSTDCFCEIEAGKPKILVTNNESNQPDSITIANSSQKIYIPTWDEQIADNVTSNDEGSSYLFGEDPFYQESSLPPHMRSGNRNLPGNYSKNNSGGETMKELESGKVASSKPEEVSTSSTKSDTEPYRANREELDMINEINLVRANPKGYVRYIEMYKQDIVDGKLLGSIETCDELINELNTMSPMPPLSSSECLLQAAKNHGEDIKAMGKFVHIGSDGSFPWDRVRKACRNMIDGNENLVGGAHSIRKLVILLLLDDGIPNRGHRKNILSDTWKYVACYKVGQIGSTYNNWVQNFGK